MGERGLLRSWELWPQEQRLCVRAAEGRLLDLRCRQAAEGDPADGERWGNERQVRAQVLLQLLTGQGPQLAPAVVAVRLRGAAIVGRLNLGELTLHCPLELYDCYLGERLDLTKATALNLSLRGSYLRKRLSARRLSVTHSLNLTGRFHCSGRVDLRGAHIGQLDCTGATLTNPGGVAVVADGLVVDGNLFLGDATVTGQVRLPLVHIGGVLHCDGATLTTKDGIALFAEMLVVDRGLFLRRAMVTGQVRLPVAHIGAQLDFDGATLTTEDGIALFAEMLVVDGNLFLRDAMVTGQVRLPFAHVSSNMQLTGATLTNEGGKALVADRLTVDGGMFLSGAKFHGEVRLAGAHIASKLDCSDAKLTSGPRSGAHALDAEGLIVDGYVCLQSKFEGEVQLSGAHITGQLDCAAASFENRWGPALNAVGLVVDGDVCLKSKCAGEVRLSGARIAGQLDCSRGKPLPSGQPGPPPGEKFSDLNKLLTTGPGSGSERSSEYYSASFSRSPNSRRRAALDLSRASVTQDVLMRPESFEGDLDLRHAQVGAWYDEKCILPKPGGIHLDGFVFDSINGKADPKERLRDWLPRNNHYIPQPYEQLAGVYRRSGDESAARVVAIGKQRARRAAITGWMRWPSRGWSAVLRWTIGYGYRPALVLIPLAVLIIIGSALFDIASHDPELLHPAKSGPEQPSFNAFRYTLDLLLPVVDFKQRGAFVTGGWTVWAAFGFTFAGWLLAAIIVAGLTGVFKRDW